MKRPVESLNYGQAEGDFLGRKWQVWYAEDIPVNSGPWKLGGLPGLILEAKDESGHVSMTASAIEGSNVPDENISYDNNYNVIQMHELNRSKQVTKEEFNRLRVQAVKDARMFVEKCLMARGDSGFWSEFFPVGKVASGKPY